jgi:quercetin dioxygenase-like cupin family protein
MADNWYVGNAAIDGKAQRGWLVGHFLEETADVRGSEAVEIKWGIHPAGEGREAWQTDEQRTTVILLVKGRFHLELTTGTFVLKEEGDYAMWGPGIDHSWHAEEDSVVITIRWPSVPNEASLLRLEPSVR